MMNQNKTAPLNENASSRPKKSKRSRVTLVGAFGFFLTLLGTIILNLLGYQVKQQYLIFFLLSFLYLFLLGLTLEQLYKRGFVIWSFSALVSFLGLFVIWLPLLLYALDIADLRLWMGSVLFGLLLLLFAYFNEAYDLNKKFFYRMQLVYDYIRSGKFLQAIKSTIMTVVFLVSAFFSAIWRALTRLPYLINKALKYVHRTIVKMFLYLKNEYDRFYFYGFLLLAWTAPFLISSTPEQFFVLNIFFVTLFFIGLVTRKSERVQRFVRTSVERTWNFAYRVNEKVERMKARMTKTQTICPNCNQNMPLNANTCPHCNATIQRCVICRLPITISNEEGERLTTCPHCHNPFHQKHWERWLQISHACPVCKTPA